jgi:putative heme-binding domain-containing protein
MAGWFADVGRSYVDGAWVDKYLREFRAEALATLTPEEKKTLAPLLAKPFEKARTVAARERSFVREWTMADLVPHLERVRTGRNHERGRQAFADAQCLACHRFGNDGGVTGPELTSAASKYDTRALLESIVEPSKVINEQYAAVTVELKDGDTLTGRLLRNSEESVEVETDPVNGTREVVPKGKVASVSPSKQSAMPAGLLNVLTLEEILHLLAYIQASR